MRDFIISFIYVFQIRALSKKFTFADLVQNRLTIQKICSIICCNYLSKFTRVHWKTRTIALDLANWARQYKFSSCLKSNLKKIYVRETYDRKVRNIFKSQTILKKNEHTVGGKDLLGEKPSF